MTYTEKELNQFLHGISLSLLSKKSAQHWRYDEETAKEIEWLEALERKVRADKADRKTENSSEKPNNCEKDCFLCKWLGDVDVCGRCRNRNLFAEADTEPTISKMEQVDKDINVRSKDEPLKTTDYCDICKRDMCEGCVADATNPYCVPSHYEINYEPKDEPLNQVKPTLAKNEPSLVKDLVKDEPQTDCGWR